MNSLVPQNSSESGIIQTSKETNYSLIIMLSNLLRNKSCFVFVINGKTRIHVNLIHKGRSLQERQFSGLLLFNRVCLDNPEISLCRLKTFALKET